MPANPAMASAVIFAQASVLAIYCAVCFAQVSNSVVVAASVNVVHLVKRPTSGLIKPRKSVRKVQFAVNAYVTIAFGAYMACNCTLLSGAFSNAPSKHARVRVVVE
jgi:hypothetical protein